MKETKKANDFLHEISGKMNIDEKRLNAFAKSRNGMMVIALSAMFLVNLVISIATMH